MMKPMQHRHGPEALDRTLRDLRKSDKPFGGITVVFGGDFRQTLPVIPKGSREEMVSASLKHSFLWSKVKVLKLTENMRAHGDPEFSAWVLSIGNGVGIQPNGNVKLPSQMCINVAYQANATAAAKEAAGVDALIKEIYPELDSLHDDEYFLGRNILSARNDDVDSINSRMLEMLPGQALEFSSADSVHFEEGADGGEPMHYPVEYLQSLTPSGLPLGKLKVKIGCPLMLLRNLDPSEGLCNGTRLRLQRTTNRVLECRILGGNHAGKIAFVPRISLSPSTESNIPFILKRRQFPVRLAFSMTINKSQGQSIGKVGLDLRTAVFSHGQLYVAVSRATGRHGIKILLPFDENNLSTRNIVYPEVLD